jgi:hypothetical protein
MPILAIRAMNGRSKHCQPQTSCCGDRGAACCTGPTAAVHIAGCAFCLAEQCADVVWHRKVSCDHSHAFVSPVVPYCLWVFSSIQAWYQWAASILLKHVYVFEQHKSVCVCGDSGGKLPHDCLYTVFKGQLFPTVTPHDCCV